MCFIKCLELHLNTVDPRLKVAVVVIIDAS